MKINREIIFKLNLKEDELENSKTAIETLLKTFIDEWRYSQKIIDLNKIIESNNSIYEIRFNIYYTPVNETAKGIIVTGFGNSKYESMFDSTAIQMQEFLNKNNYTYEIFAPVEKMSVGFEEFLAAIDDIEEELSKFKTIDDSIKVKLSY
ncbi:MAG TPA: hypothetical protein PLQ81_11860, partial [bacterium]|nr:hypothetical protein [bacterium]